MKARDHEKGYLLRPATMSVGAVRHRDFNDLKERALTDLLLSALFAVIVALCLAMVVGLYCWGHHAQMFPSEYGSAVTEQYPWLG